MRTVLVFLGVFALAAGCASTAPKGESGESREALARQHGSKSGDGVGGGGQAAAGDKLGAGGYKHGSGKGDGIGGGAQQGIGKKNGKVEHGSGVGTGAGGGGQDGDGPKSGIHGEPDDD